MAFLRPTLMADAVPVLRRGGVVLRAPGMADYSVWAELRARSRAALVPYEPAWTEDELTQAAFRDRLRRYQREARDGLGFAFFVFSEARRTMVGAISLSNVRRGVSQTASVGYWIGSGHTRNGYASTALAAVAGFAFDDLGLHRIEAACLPTNTASLGVLARCGFKPEGLARGYLRINGAWEDHILHALLAEDPRP